MSHYWCLRCPLCDRCTEDLNRGETVLESVVKVFPQIKRSMNSFAEAQSKMGDDGWRLGIKLTLCGYAEWEEDLWDFIEEHYTHGLVLQSEYPTVPDRPIDYIF